MHGLLAQMFAPSPFDFVDSKETKSTTAAGPEQLDIAKSTSELNVDCACTYALLSQSCSRSPTLCCPLRTRPSRRSSWGSSASCECTLCTREIQTLTSWLLACSTGMANPFHSPLLSSLAMTKLVSQPFDRMLHQRALSCAQGTLNASCLSMLSFTELPRDGSM
jgi:hypothetical protein